MPFHLSISLTVYQTEDSSLTLLGGTRLRARDLSSLFLYSIPCLTKS